MRLAEMVPFSGTSADKSSQKKQMKILYRGGVRSKTKKFAVIQVLFFFFRYAKSNYFVLWGSCSL